MPLSFVPLIIVAVIGLFFLVFIIKTITAPKKTDEIARLTKDGKNAAAIKLAKTLIEKNDRNFLAKYYLAKAYLASGRADLAFAELKNLNENAIFEKSGLIEEDFRHDMAELYTQFNQPEEALKEYLLLIKMEPTNAKINFEAAKLFEQRDKPEQAIKYYKQAIQIDKKYAQAHAALALMLMQTKQIPEAKAEIDYAIRINPNAFSSYYYLGKILKETKDYAGAISAFEKSMRDSEYKQRSLLERGVCYIAANKTDKAISELERAVSCSKSDSSSETIYSRYFLASCYEKMRNFENALKQWEAIQMVKRNFRDVNAKITQYKDLEENDFMKDFLTSSTNDFLEICKNVTLKHFSLLPQEISPEQFGCSIKAAAKGKDNSWMNVRMQQTLLYFYRENTPVDDSTLRRILETMKQSNIAKCIICTSSGFSSSALHFAEGRPFELIGKEQMNALLANAG